MTKQMKLKCNKTVVKKKYHDRSINGLNFFKVERKKKENNTHENRYVIKQRQKYFYV